MTHSRLAIFMDGDHLYRVAEPLGYRKIDYRKTAANIIRDMERHTQCELPLLKVYFYTCLKDDDRGSNNFAATVRSWSNFELRLGKLQPLYDGDKILTNEAGDPRQRQKRVDVHLAVDLVYFSLKQMITHAAIVAGDSDFIPAIELVRKEGIFTGLYYGKKCHRELIDCVDQPVSLLHSKIAAPLS